MRIIYVRPEGTVTVIAPAKEWENRMEDLAQKCVPTGLKYKIVEDSEISSDRSFRDAWEIDEAELTDGVGADFGVLK